MESSVPAVPNFLHYFVPGTLARLLFPEGEGGLDGRNLQHLGTAATLLSKDAEVANGLRLTTK
jgi:hypothetical protein